MAPALYNRLVSDRFPARLHILLAQDGQSGVVIRRGPAKAVCLVGWDRAKDRFETGQWLRGRIYERRADLSPDGRYLIYFAMNGHWRGPARGAWTAVSCAPWLKAIVLLGKGDYWHGGGLFLDRSTYWLNDGYGHQILRDSAKVRRDPSYVPTRSFGGECPGVSYLRLLRDGWLLTGEIGQGGRDARTLFEKDLPRGWVLRKHAHEQQGPGPGRCCYWDEHELEHRESGRRLELPGWEWANRDGGSLVFAEQGRLYRARLPDATGLGEPRLLQDFNEMEFAAVRAPY